ncbi:sensor histidine kinase [Bacteriovorax sp. DB6_IX]|uniref:sensor histidine kinase n=1 Tax=Bacteriovorax sp. DB6_IX TaxID=1353530 RepID=UPI00038A3B6F|nr:HAMP domain-containing sensor histidine kinase [Bacteriovorax sp. DB6_IX]EQC51590.1 GHKL domain protein [Bacteriovorax sp. DB6_IX]
MHNTPQERSEIFIMPFLVTLSASGYFFALLYAFYYKTEVVHWHLIGAVTTSWLYKLIKKFTRNYNLYANWLIVCCLYGLAVPSYFMGSLNSPAIWWLIFVPVIAAFFLDLIQTFIWSLITLSVIALLTLSHLDAFSWLNYINELKTDSPLLAISLSLFSIVTCITTLILYLRSVIEKLESQKATLLEESYIHSSSQSLGELASSIAHEVNNPLAIIKGHANFLEEKTKRLDIAPDIKESLIAHIRRIDASTNSASTTVRSLGYLTRGINLESPEIFSIREVLDVVTDLNKKKFLLKNIELIYEKNLKLDEPKVYASKGQIIQVLINLIENAYEAVGDSLSSWVRISFERDLSQRFILVKITDSGIISSLPERHNFFKPLYTTKDVGEGKGLGLSLSKTIMKKNNGDLYIDQASHKQASSSKFHV